jgi:predicted transcriptional regulator
MTTPTSRRAKGTIPDMVLSFINNHQVAERFTPYGIAKFLKLSPGSVTAACKSLVRDDLVRLYGTSPYMIGRKES